MDRLCDFISNLQLGEKRNAIVSLVAGALVRITCLQMSLNK